MPQNIFVGRSTEIEELERWVRDEPNPRVPTRLGVLVGAAGMGKSSILKHLDTRLDDASTFVHRIKMNGNEGAAAFLERLLHELSALHAKRGGAVGRLKRLGTLLLRAAPKAGGGPGECIGDFVTNLLHAPSPPYQKFLKYCRCVSDHTEPGERLLILVDPRDTMAAELPDDWLSIADELPPKIRLLIAQRPDDALARHPECNAKCVRFPRSSGTLGDLSATDVRDWYRAEARDTDGLLAGRDQGSIDLLADAAYERYRGYPGAHGAVLRLIVSERPADLVLAIQAWPKQVIALMNALFDSLGKQGEDRVALVLTLQCFGVATPQPIWREATGLTPEAMSIALSDARFRHFMRCDAAGNFAPYHALFAERLERELAADLPATEARATRCYEIVKRVARAEEDFALEAMRPVAARLPGNDALIDTLNYVMRRKHQRGMLSSLEADVLFALEAPQMQRPWLLATANTWLGDVRIVQGDLVGAQGAYEAAMAIASAIAMADLRNTQWQRDLAVNHNKIGDVRAAQGDLTGAHGAYEEALKIATRLAEADPRNTEWQRDLSISHNKIGDMRAAQGDLAGAQKAYEDGMAIATRLTASNPRNTEWQRDLFVSRVKIGDMRDAQGDLAEAREAYDAGIEIATRLAASDPQNTQWQRDLSISHTKVGDVRAAQGDLDGAQKSYEAGLEIAALLAASDPRNTQRQRDLSISHEKIGDVRAARGDLAGAQKEYQVTLEIRASLAASDPRNTRWQRAFSVSHNKIGDVRQALGDLAGAEQAYEVAMKIAARLAASDPRNTEWQRDVFACRARVGSLLAAQGNSAAARQHFEAAGAIMASLVAHDPRNAQWKKDLSEIEAALKSLDP